MALMCKCVKCGESYLQADIPSPQDHPYVCPKARMPFPPTPEPLINSAPPVPSLIGKFGVCSIGRPGYITGRKEMPWGMAWVGIGLDGLGPWSSRNPKIVTPEEMQELLVKITSRKEPDRYSKGLVDDGVDG